MPLTLPPIIEAHIKGFFTRKKFSIPKLKDEECENYRVFVKGNDPEITLHQHQAEERVLLIATSGLRAVDLACRLQKNTQILLIDYSLPVICLWRRVKAACKASQSLHDLPYHFHSEEGSIELFDDQEAIEYLSHLSEQFGFSAVKQIIGDTQLIPQYWENEDTFRVIHNIIEYQSYHAVYVYASNIASALYFIGYNRRAETILKNIASLDPDLAIHTNVSEHGEVTEVSYIHKGAHLQQFTEPLVCF